MYVCTIYIKICEHQHPNVKIQKSNGLHTGQSPNMFVLLESRFEPYGKA